MTVFLETHCVDLELVRLVIFHLQQACSVFWLTDYGHCLCGLKYKDRHFYLCWLKTDKLKTHSLPVHMAKQWFAQYLIKLMKSQTCLAWKSPFLSQLGMGIVKRSSCVRVFDANLSNARCSSARHGACRTNSFWLVCSRCIRKLQIKT